MSKYRIKRRDYYDSQGKEIYDDVRFYIEQESVKQTKEGNKYSYIPIRRKGRNKNILFFTEKGETRNFIDNILEKDKPWGTSVDTIVE